MLQHLACIMDGNRRWARERGMVSWYGHKYGIDAVKRTVQFCLKKNIAHLSLYAFALQNFKRAGQENAYLFDLLTSCADEFVELIVKHNVRVRFIGDWQQFPSPFVSLYTKIQVQSASHTALQLHILFCYGGREELAYAAQRIAQQVRVGALKINDITPAVVAQHVWTAGIPDPDLIVRTGGDQRLSNFLLFQAAYAELYFLNCWWPDVQEEQLQQAVDYFNSCQRNFGK